MAAMLTHGKRMLRASLKKREEKNACSPQVLQVQEDDLEVRYLRQKDGKYYFPDTEDDAWIVRADIVGHLDMVQMASRVFH